MNMGEILKITIIIIVALLFTLAVFGSFPVESKTIYVKCYDRFSNEIEGLQCKEVVTCNLLDKYTQGCDSAYAYYEKNTRGHR